MTGREVHSAADDPESRPDGVQRLYKRYDYLKLLRTYCHAARLRSMSRAAEHLGSNQPAVSQRVRALEKELGVTLFKRRGPRISLSREGERLYAYAMPLVEGVDRLPATFAERHYGAAGNLLNIGAGQTSAAYLLPEYVEQFRQSCPGVRIEIRTGTGEQRLRWLRDFEVDIVVAGVDVVPSGVDFHPVLDSKLVLITAEDHALAGRDSVALEEVAAYPFVGHSATLHASHLFETMLRLQGVAPDVVVEVDGWSMIANYVAAGVGISFVPDLCLTPHDRLWKITLDNAVAMRRYGVITRCDGMLATVARRFVEIMASVPPDAHDER